MKVLTKEQAIILTAFTGILCLENFSDYHQAVEAKLKRPVFTHEFPQLSKEIKEAFRQDFMNLVHSEHNLELEHVKQSRDLFTKHISKIEV